MKVYKHSNSEYGGGRQHPWTNAEDNPTNRYYNFKGQPELIRTSLEDLIPWDIWPAIDKFYQIIEWINSDDSVLESNDCAFRGPFHNSNHRFQKSLQCIGRLLILYRDLVLNTSKEHVEWLDGAIHFYLDKKDPDFLWGVIGTTIVDVQYITLDVCEKKQYGYQLALKFWAWGDSDEECMSNCLRVLNNLKDSLISISTETKESFA